MVPATDTSLPPFFKADIELLGLVSGLRRAAKKEGPDAIGLMAVADELRAGGWHVEKNDRTGCAYVSADPALVARLIELENREFGGGDPENRRATIRETGIALGYPECCAEAFAAQPVQDDGSVMKSLMSRARSSDDLPWQLNFLIPMTGPVFYYPCRLDCAASLALAGRYLAAMESARPGAAERLRNILARPMLVAGRWDFVAFDGHVNGDGAISYTGFQTARDFHPVPAPSPAFAAFVSNLPPAGTIRTQDGVATACPAGSDVIGTTLQAHTPVLILNYR